MAGERFAILDPSAGISGDMLLGALVDAGAPASWLLELPARLGLEGVRVEIRREDRCGVACTKVDVRLASGEMETPHEVAETPDDARAVQAHAHHHHDDPDAHQHAHGAHGHRHVADLIRMVEAAPLSPWVRERAVRAFRLLGEAEGRAHGVPAGDVALHEVGAADALVDIVGGIEGFERLGLTRVYHRPVALGTGWVRAAHGVLPVPAPATAFLLEGLEIRDGGPVVGEATTPTGAVLLRVLSEGPPPTRWRATGAMGWGAGGRNPAGYPNALRLLLAEAAAEAGEVEVIATDVDDLSPEYLDPLREALFAAGALDVQLWATQAKKGRAGFRIEVTVPPSEVARVEEALFRHSSTGGVRRWRAARTTLPRREITLELEHGMSLRVKVLDGPGGVRVKPEFEDVARVAARWGRPAREVAEEMQQRALRELGVNGGAGAVGTNQES
ncbi:MAG TPA: nickel pincer cofactor biosynthesis protein LarC [Gemmatimonadales bacterium]|nr:nickel pincer cofactor biosynthesis protein LarC [Gemmatimonadales bacterium]